MLKGLLPFQSAGLMVIFGFERVIFKGTILALYSAICSSKPEWSLFCETASSTELNSAAFSIVLLLKPVPLTPSGSGLSRALYAHYALM